MQRYFSDSWLLLFLAPLFWGGNSVAGKLASDHWHPFTITAVRWVMVALVLLPFAWRPLRSEKETIRDNASLLLLLGVLLGAFNLCMYLALKYTSAINVAIEQAAMPVLIMLFNFALLRVRVWPIQIAGLVLTIVGVIVTATQGEPWLLLSSDVNRGDVWMIIGCVFYAAYSFTLRWRPSMDWMAFMWTLSVGAFVVSLPLAVWELSQLPMLPLSVDGLLILAYVVIFPSILGQIFFARGVELIGANRAGIFINLVPVYGAILAVLILGESFQLFHLVGLFLVLGGILLAEKAAPSAR